MTKYFATTALMSTPKERAAFSDRQAYVCAELSRLAYINFEGGHRLEDVLSVARRIFGDDERLGPLEAQLRAVLADGAGSEIEARDVLTNILKAADFSLIDTISTNGTQAFICTHKVQLESGTSKTVAFLAFRGTEVRDFRDIKTDARAALKRVEFEKSVFELHSGYLSAYNEVKEDIKRILDATAHDQLFITGHSLGGALAIVATRFLASDSTGACYTFGAPPVGTVDVQSRLKTPVYEIINEIDIVPRLPNPWSAELLLYTFRLLLLLGKSVTVVNKILADGNWDEKLDKFIQTMTLYRHTGYVSYLVGRSNSARLRYSVADFDRFKWWSKMIWKKSGGFGKMVSDHSIEEYVSKLKVHGLSRL